jgi:(1->4)-alpha-D-glucan 1-alpha-D-glucosylmutase
VPEIYQGNELWDYSLVDPDNRRPVDFARRRALLDELRRAADRIRPDRRFLAAALLRTSHDGRVKLYVTHRALALRRAAPELFRCGRYLPLAAQGRAREHVCAFARVAGDDAVVAVAPRLTLKLAGGAERPPVGDIWGDARVALPADLPAGAYRDAFTGATISLPGPDGALRLADTLGTFPLALLHRDQA